MKFVKKPIVIEAVELRWDNWSEMCEHAGVGKLSEGKPMGCYVGADGLALPAPHADPRKGNGSEIIGLLIPTLEGLMLARQGDYVIRGEKGELYPCKPDVFAESYEPFSAT